MGQKTSSINKQRILELYLCGNDKRINFISAITGNTPFTVSNVVQDFFDKKIVFERGDYQILHSGINYINNTEFNKISNKL